MSIGEFESARLRRLFDRDNSETEPEEALELARMWLAENQTTGNLIVVIEKEEGGVTCLSSRVTLAEAVYLLEAAKCTLMTDTGEDDQ